MCRLGDRSRHVQKPSRRAQAPIIYHPFRCAFFNYKQRKSSKVSRLCRADRLLARAQTRSQQSTKQQDLPVAAHFENCATRRVDKTATLTLRNDARELRIGTLITRGCTQKIHRARTPAPSSDHKRQVVRQVAPAENTIGGKVYNSGSRPIGGDVH